MPWKNQGGGPWGSGPKGPWGSGPQSSGPRPPDLEDLLRRGQDRLQQLLPGGHFSAMGIALIAGRRAGDLGPVRLLPGAVRRTRRRAALRQARPHRAARPELSSAVSDRDRAAAEGAARLHHQHRHDADQRSGPARHHDARRARRKPDADRRREHRRRRLHRAVAHQAGRRRQLPVQHPEPRRHREGGGRKRDARSDRPLQHPADPDRRPHHHRKRRAGPDAEDARRLRRRRAGAAGADAEGRSAVAGDRRVPRRAGGARRPRAAAERSADLRQSRHPRCPRPRARRSCRSPKATRSRRSPRPRARARASSTSTKNTGRRPT